MRKLALGISLCSAASVTAQSAIEVDGLPADAPLTISAQATRDVLIVDFALRPEWHVYARDVGGGQPVDVQLASDCDFTANGDVQFPPDDGGKLTGKVRLRLPLVAAGKGSQLRAQVDFMVCDPLACLPPMSVTIAGKIDPCGVLLVVAAESERASRISKSLTERGFEVHSTTYAEVTAEQCDTHDVVLADSQLFGKARGVRKLVLEFPRTRSPIVAVGFFGTELIEAHGIAMTSGYI